jgi:hypothetical protein
MRYDQILSQLTPGADYTFETTTINVVIRDRNGIRTIQERVPIFDDYNAIMWNDQNITQPTEQECVDKWEELTTETDLQTILDNRRNGILSVYPVHEQLEALIEKDLGRPQKWDDIINHYLQIKTQYPKPGEQVL